MTVLRHLLAILLLPFLLRSLCAKRKAASDGRLFFLSFMIARHQTVLWRRRHQPRRPSAAKMLLRLRA